MRVKYLYIQTNKITASLLFVINRLLEIVWLHNDKDTSLSKYSLYNIQWDGKMPRYSRDCVVGNLSKHVNQKVCENV